ncbi:alpha/beta hydrolase [Phragmitibacter flavus]|uniref:Alpha/beta hydrolase n=1 Tax=Phragmitibacter flavus TaxID=2576071 RepID=A0A5R8K9P2_9BACT|nr:alpha/beta hydrolase [Phragmitibacter flavus]TLD69021.1 alpha/beta hydrolase [Phragmitibacter flavus]
MKKLTPLLALFGFALSSQLVAAELSTVLELWPKGAPEAEGFKMEAEHEVPKKSDTDVKRVTNVTVPTIAVYKPEKPNGTAVIVCPGGGYSILAIEHEGTQVCEWLNTLGVTGILLKYRVPARDKADPSKVPVQDLQRAMGLVRKNAEAWGFKADRVGVLGFSAGGNLAVLGSLHANERTYMVDPALDVEDATPNFLLPIYPAYLTEKENGFVLRPEIKVTKTSPPVFLIHAHDDPVTPTGSALLYLEYKKAGVPAELHIFASGGHGYGMRKGDKPVFDWPQRAGEWLRSAGWLEMK